MEKSESLGDCDGQRNDALSANSNCICNEKGSASSKNLPAPNDASTLDTESVKLPERASVGERKMSRRNGVHKMQVSQTSEVGGECCHKIPDEVSSGSVERSHRSDGNNGEAEENSTIKFPSNDCTPETADVIVQINDGHAESVSDTHGDSTIYLPLMELSSTSQLSRGVFLQPNQSSHVKGHSAYEKRAMLSPASGRRIVSRDSQPQPPIGTGEGALRRLLAHQRTLSSASDVSKASASSSTAAGSCQQRCRTVSMISVDQIPHIIEESLKNYLGLPSETGSVLEEKDVEPRISSSRPQRVSVFSIYSVSSNRSDVTFCDPLEALPHADLYQRGHPTADPDSAKDRPTLNELREGPEVPNRPSLNTSEDPEIPSETENTAEERKVKVISEAAKLGWIQGVLIRCLLNIFGVMLFLRLTWITGQAGIGLSSVIILVSALVTTLTVMSMSAIGTNGDVGGGGAYYIASRSLGPEFGGALGAVFSLANAVAVAMHVVGFAETLRDLLNEKGFVITGDLTNDIRLIGCVTIAFLLCVVMMGLDFQSKAQAVLLLILIVALANYFVGTVIPPSEDKRRLGFVGYQGSVLSKNFGPDFRESGGTEYDFFKIFAIFFPSATGVLAGANISGDLKNPAAAIPRGTFLAILITTAVYLAIVWTCGSCMIRDAVGPAVAIASNISLTLEEIQTCGNKTCDYGLHNTYAIMGVASAFHPLIYAGIFSATLSSALDSLVSAPKVLQALAKDKLFPFIGLFAKGYGRGGEPRLGHILTFFIAVGITCIGSLDVIAPIISNFFLISFLIINYSCFDAALANTPGFRPSFRFFNKWLSLAGALLCLVIMFLLKWWAAMATVVVVAALYGYLKHSKPDVNWGTSSQARAYNNALTSTIRLVNIHEHVKNFRPQILALTGCPYHRPALVDFAYSITKRQSLLLCGHVLEGDLQQHMRHHQSAAAVYGWFRKCDVRAFYTCLAAPSVRHGIRTLFQCQGLGKLRPNTVLMGFKADWQEVDPSDVHSYVGIIHDAFDLNFGVGILRLPCHLDTCKVSGDPLSSADEIAEDSGKSLNKADKDLPDNDNTHKKSRICKRVLSGKRNSEKMSFRNGVVCKLFKTTQLQGHDNSAYLETEIKDGEHKTAMKGNTKLEYSDDSSYGEGKTGLERAKTNEEEKIEAGEDKTFQTSSAQSHDTMNSAEIFKVEQRGTIDVWWLFDDGGLGLLIPYILTTRKRWQNCRLRVFCAGTKRSSLETDFTNMAGLLRKFRIDYSDITVLSDLGQKPHPKSNKEFQELVGPWRLHSGEVHENYPWKVSDSDLKSHKEKTYMQIKIREKLLEHSAAASLIIVTLPVPRKSCPAGLYMAWLDTLTRDLPPTLLLRGNQQSVLTYLS